MSDVIRFLESMGSDASGGLSPFDYAASVAQLDIDPAQQRALLERDHVSLGNLLGGRIEIRCSIFAPDEDEERRDNDEPEEPSEPE